MNDMSGMSDEQRDELVEEHLRHARGQGPEPDLSSLSAVEAEDVRQSFAIVDALSGMLPASPPIEEDPVAARLGIVSPSGSSSVKGDQDERYPLVAHP